MGNMMKIKGVITKGLGEGRFFLSLPPYKKGFEKALGFAPFEGTLNVRLDLKYIEFIESLKKNPDFIVPGFEFEGRKYFQIKLSKASIFEEKGALIFPYFNHHPPEVVEFVAKISMREKYKLNDGDEVEININK
jgi:riboflavin kinase